MSTKNFKPSKCDCCNQTTNYLLIIARGSRDSLRGIAKCIKDKGINCVHIQKEVEAQKYITSNQRSNINCLQAHGLVARVKGEAGNYALTNKGIQWLRNEIRIPKYAIRDKITNQTIGYFEPEKNTVGVLDFKRNDDNWEVQDYVITEGRVVPVTI